MSIKLGLIGAGAISKQHAKAAAAVGVEVVGITDVNATAAAATAKEFNIPYHTDSVDELLARPGLQAVVVAVPNKFHAPLTIKALQAGKDVLVEKPMGLNAGECQQMIDAAAAGSRILQLGMVHRYSAVGVTAKRYIDAGRMGQLYHAKTNMYRRRGIPGLGGWFTTKALSGGGPLIDIGVHVIDLACYLMDFPKPTRVSGKVYANFGKDMKAYLYENMWAGPPRYDGVCDVEDSAHALIRFEGGLTLEVNATWAGNFPNNTMPNLVGIFGSKAGLTFQLGGSEVKIATEDEGHNADISPTLRTVVPFEDQMRTFAGHVTSRTQPHANGARGKLVQSLLDAIYESSRLDREVEV